MTLKLVLIGGKPIEEFDDKFYHNFKYEIKENSFELTEEQKKCLQEIANTNSKFNVHVLQGTTGSGKTFVYFEALKDILKKNIKV